MSNVTGIVTIDKVCYFPLSSKKLSEFEFCKHNIQHLTKVIDNTIYIRLQWHLVTFFADSRQLKALDAFRKHYVQGLIRHHCQQAKQCFASYVGSNTSKSDIDINLSCPTVEDVIHNILRDHLQRFEDGLDTMFDSNLYGSVFHYLTKTCNIDSIHRMKSCYPRHKSTYKQRVWSFLRFVQALQKESTLSQSLILRSMPLPYQKLAKDSRKLMRSMQRKRGQVWYSKYLRLYMNITRRADHDPELVAERFSRCKYFENDAYYTVGAVLHIVEGATDLDKNTLYDSIYDNLGFAVEVILKHGICHSMLTSVKVMKACKYIARICDAYHKMTGKKNLDWLYNEAERLNLRRKMSSGLQQKDIESIHNLFSKLKIQSDDLDDIVIGLVRFVLSVLPRDPLLTSNM